MHKHTPKPTHLHTQHIQTEHTHNINTNTQTNFASEALTLEPKFDVDELLFTEKQLKQCAAEVIRDDGSTNKVNDECACRGCQGKKARGSNASLCPEPGPLLQCNGRPSHLPATSL